MFLLAAVVAVHGQKRKPKTVKKTPSPVVKSTPAPEPTPAVEQAVKKNERPKDGSGDQNSSASKLYTPNYFYEFNRPGFDIPRILIEHDEAGRGNISFQKDGSDQMITDPIALSAVAMTKLRDTLNALNFLDSTENYQYVKDYSHLGNVTITVKRDGKTRTVKYNWTENKGALALMTYYRGIANEYIWKFDISVARQNQPLLTPELMDRIVDYVSRGEIADPAAMIPFLTELSTDERMPLIARNRAAKLIQTIEKAKK